MRQRGQKNYAPLVKGLNTEASPLNAPEGSTSDEVNMILDTDGLIRKPRKGLCSFFTFPEETYEPAISQTSLGLLGTSYWSREDYIIVLTAYTREEEGDEETDPHLFYIDRYLYFVNPQSTDIEFQYFWREAIPTYTGVDEPSPEDIERAEDLAVRVGATFSPLNEGIVVTTGDEPLYLRPNTNGLDVFIINPQVRDFLRLETGVSVSARPSAISGAHRYNLYNAGWHVRTYEDEAGADILNLVDYYKQQQGVFPSQASVPQLGTRTESQTGDKYFDPDELDSISFGNSEAPRGHYVFPIRRINRASKITAKDNDGTFPNPVVNILEDGDAPGTGTPPPSGGPIGPINPPPSCIPGEICTVEP